MEVYLKQEKKDEFSQLKISVTPVCQYCRSKQEVPMPPSFLRALLLLLFLLPQWRQAVGRRPKAGGQVNMSSREYRASSCTALSVYLFQETGQKASNNTPRCRVISFWELTFSFSSSVQTFSSSSSPWAEGRVPHQRRGCKRRQSRGDISVFIPLTGYEM